MRASIAILAAACALAALAPRDARAQCASGAACPNPCTSCRVAPVSGTNPTVADMAVLFDRIAEGPTRYGTLGWNFAGRTTIGAGRGWCTGSGRRDTVPVTFPCVLLKSIYVTESNWRQFCDSGRTVVSFDCGYGIAQVTSGMRRGETSAYDPNRVASSAAYNVSVGAAILTDKWRASPCVGDNDPQVIEHWYFAVWGYNGFAFSNNPNNPMYAASRPEFRTPGVASAQVRGNYPYQELVFGYAHYPPSASHYTGVALAYPRRSEICASCGLPTASISEPAGAHRSDCPGATTPTDAGTPDATPPPDATMPRDAEPTADGAASDATLPPRDGQPLADASGIDGARRDAGADAIGARELGPVEGGCGCRVNAGSRRAAGARAGGVAALLALLGAASLRARRRRRR